MYHHERGQRFSTKNRDGRRDRGRQERTEDPERTAISPESQLRKELRFIVGVVQSFKALEAGATAIEFQSIPRTIFQAMVREMPSMTSVEAIAGMVRLDGAQVEELWSLSQMGRVAIDRQVQETFADPFTLRCAVELTSAQDFFGAISVLAMYSQYSIESNRHEVFSDNRLYSFVAARIDFGKEIGFPCKFVLTRSLAPWAIRQLEAEESAAELVSFQKINPEVVPAETEMETPAVAETKEAQIEAFTQQLFEYLQQVRMTEEKLSRITNIKEYQAASRLKDTQFMFGVTVSAEELPEVVALFRKFSFRNDIFTYHSWKITNTRTGVTLEYGNDNTFTLDAVKRLILVAVYL